MRRDAGRSASPARAKQTISAVREAPTGMAAMRSDRRDGTMPATVLPVPSDQPEPEVLVELDRARVVVIHAQLVGADAPARHRRGERVDQQPPDSVPPAITRDREIGELGRRFVVAALSATPAVDQPPQRAGSAADRGGDGRHPAPASIAQHFAPERRRLRRPQHETGGGAGFDVHQADRALIAGAALVVEPCRPRTQRRQQPGQALAVQARHCVDVLARQRNHRHAGASRASRLKLVNVQAPAHWRASMHACSSRRRSSDAT